MGEPRAEERGGCKPGAGAQVGRWKQEKARPSDENKAISLQPVVEEGDGGGEPSAARQEPSGRSERAAQGGGRVGVGWWGRARSGAGCWPSGGGVVGQGEERRRVAGCRSVFGFFRRESGVFRVLSSGKKEAKPVYLAFSKTCS